MDILKFTLANAMELLPDARRRTLAGEARKWADVGFPMRKLFKQGATYWDGVVKEHERLFWCDTYTRRRARLSRMAAKA